MVYCRVFKPINEEEINRKREQNFQENIQRDRRDALYTLLVWGIPAFCCGSIGMAILIVVCMRKATYTQRIRKQWYLEHPETKTF